MFRNRDLIESYNFLNDIGFENIQAKEFIFRDQFIFHSVDEIIEQTNSFYFVKEYDNDHKPWSEIIFDKLGNKIDYIDYIERSEDARIDIDVRHFNFLMENYPVGLLDKYLFAEFLFNCAIDPINYNYEEIWIMYINECLKKL